MVEFDFGKVENIIGFNKYIEEKLSEKQKIIDEQQSTITHLEKVNGKNFAKRRLLEQDNLVLRNENEQLRQQLANYELAKRNLIKRLDDREKEDFERFFK